MRNFVPSALAVIVGFYLLFSPLNEAKAQSTPVNPQTAAALQAKLDDLITTNNLKGLSASVIIPGNGTWKGVSGISHAGVPIDTAMVFSIGSITKNFTAAAILLLQQDSLISLSDSLHEFLPTYPNINPNITIRHLLRQTSGIYNYTSNPSWQQAAGSNPAQAMLPQFVLNNFIGAPYFAPGASHYYSNTNYLLLGLIVEQVTGQSYASFIRQRLLDPLQLSSFYMRDHEPAMGVLAHNWTSPNPSGPGTDMSGFPLTSVFGTSAADGALAGNAHDLARWGQLLYTGQVLQDTSLQLMKQFVSFNSVYSGYGLGLMRFGSGNTQTWGHNGIIMGYNSCLMFSPADSIVVSVLSNKSANSISLAWALMAIARQQLVTAAPAEVAGIRDALVCYPNPVQGKGSVKYTLRKAQPVEITLQNSLGQTVQTLFSQPQSAGEHSLTINTKSLPSGMYFCTLQTTDSKLVQRWVLTQ
jgi:D-alanyl-D-alanine carboxypeptidase